MLLPEKTTGVGKEFATDFLLSFTKELIEHTAAYQKALLDAELQGLIKKGDKKKESFGEKVRLAREFQKREVRSAVQQKMKEEEKKLSGMYIKGLPLQLEELAAVPRAPVAWQKPILKKPVLRIEETPLPPTVSYLKPQATGETIDVGSLNVLVNDPLVKIIECNGPGENILVSGIMGRKPTALKLTQEQIEEVVGKFAAASRIPINEGLFKAAVGNLVLSAVISDIAGIKFIIRKISQEISI